jgi:hypothetical protein
MNRQMVACFWCYFLGLIAPSIGKSAAALLLVLCKSTLPNFIKNGYKTSIIDIFEITIKAYYEHSN